MQTDVPIGGPALPDLPGDRYELVGVLGEGGMATVYSAIDTETAEWCAIKVLHPKFLGKQKVRSRFATEAQAMKRLRHRNVIHVFDVCTDNAHPYFAMELARGGCVVEWLATFGPMPPRMAVDVVIQVCKGLGAAHRQGVIHRDVKPHNILVNRRGVCKITDFGIARLDDDPENLRLVLVQLDLARQVERGAHLRGRPAGRQLPRSGWERVGACCLPPCTGVGCSSATF